MIVPWNNGIARVRKMYNRDTRQLAGLCLEDADGVVWIGADVDEAINRYLRFGGCAQPCRNRELFVDDAGFNEPCDR